MTTRREFLRGAAALAALPVVVDLIPPDIEAPAERFLVKSAGAFGPYESGTYQVVEWWIAPDGRAGLKLRQRYGSRLVEVVIKRPGLVIDVGEHVTLEPLSADSGVDPEHSSAD